MGIMQADMILNQIIVTKRNNILTSCLGFRCVIIVP